MTYSRRDAGSFEMLSNQLRERYGSRTLYEGLGVNPDATPKYVRNEFRKKAEKYHPIAIIQPSL